MKAGSILVLAAGTRFVYYSSQSNRMANAATLPGASTGVIRYQRCQGDPWDKLWQELWRSMLPQMPEHLPPHSKRRDHHTAPQATISDGMAWSSNGAVMYYIDSATGGIDYLD